MKAFAPRPAASPQATATPGKGAALVDNRPATVAQRKLQATIAASPRQVAPVPLVAPRRNTTGLPDQLKAGVESLSGHSLDDVKVHYNSAKPAQLQALAYAQGTNIHIGPGQEKHLPHEAWHVVQQKQGRVRPTKQLRGITLNDNIGLENEATIMGYNAQRTASTQQQQEISSQIVSLKYTSIIDHVAQYVKDKRGNEIKIDWENLTAEEANKILNFIYIDNKFSASVDEVTELQFIAYAERVPRETTEGVSYEGAQLSSSFSSRRKYAPTTDYPDNPLSIANQHLKGDDVHYSAFLRLNRPGMSETFTKTLITDAKAKQNPNQHETKMMNGQKLSEAGVSRNHRLADSSIRAIIAVAFRNLANTTLAPHKQQMLLSLKSWATALGDSDKSKHFENSLEEYEKNPRGQTHVGHLQSGYNALSVNTTNVRFGDSDLNQRASNAADWGLASGALTPKSTDIKSATLKLVDVCLITQELAEAATTQARDKRTGAFISSV